MSRWIGKMENFFHSFIAEKQKSIWNEIHASDKLKDLFIKYGLTASRTLCATDKRWECRSVASRIVFDL